MSTLEISYGQVCIFDSTLKEPFNEWRPEHNAQGFSWRPGSVSFATLVSSATLEYSVTRKPYDPAASQAIRVIQVPFTVPEHPVELASISGSVKLQLPAGEYALIFEHWRGTEEDYLHATFRFVPTDKRVEPKVLKQDAELKPGASFLMTASPAT